MCTVAFLPYNNKFYFASLRDESPKREQALPPTIYNIDGIEILAPLDGLAGGTWVGASAFGNIVILLNGAFENHERADRYVMSRGVIVKNLLAQQQPVAAWQLIDLQNIEPFTLVVWQQQLLYELVWDGQQKHWQQLAITKPRIWSSSTLYNVAAKQQRKAAFQHWWATGPSVSKQSLLSFFASRVDLQNGFLINRSPTMQTLSFTFLTQDAATTTCYYHNFLNATCSTKQLALKHLTLAL
ncbi:MAG: NRDE family protein [Flavobacterium sp.]|nr:NRDE family protein [Flavobacterium sp.]